MNRHQFKEAFEKLLKQAPRRAEVLQKVLAWYADDEIAQLMGIKKGTVRNQISKIYRIFGIEGNWEGDRHRRREDLMHLFAKYNHEWVCDSPSAVTDEALVAATAKTEETSLRTDIFDECEGAIAKPHRESREAVDALASGLSVEQEVDHRFYQLCELLTAERWLEADRETLAIMLKVSAREKEHWLTREDIKKISRQVLHTIDQLWVTYSYKRFGFSVQRELMKLIRLRFGGTDVEAWLKFATCIGWRKNNNLWLTWPEIELKISVVGNIAESFPVGFFPYQYSLGSKIHRNDVIGVWRQPSPVSAFLLLDRDF